ncbi:MAG TPA: MarR family transcriptional regulator [Bacteroidetes bacterium]|nr:MarR family transcriptional regulator [Bacteroidota bacterium]
MRLEEEIQQSTFRNERQKLLINLFYTYNVLSTKMQEFLKSESLTMQQYNILRILRGQHPNPATNSLVKERMLDKNSDVTRIIDRMIRDGLVSRVNCEADRRRVDITITELGMQKLSRLDQQAAVMDEIGNGVTEDEAVIVNTMLDKLRTGCKSTT